MNRMQKKLAFYKSKIGIHGITNWRTVAKSSHYWSQSPAKKESVNPWRCSCRWIENPNKIGLRFVGFCDEIVRINHKGWFTDNIEFETYRGVVWQLPARKGVELFVFGYVDSCNPEAAFIDFKHVNSKEKAAWYADKMAESSAEESRDYFAKDQAKQDVEQAKDEIHENNLQALELIKEIKKAGSFSPAICAALKNQLKIMLQERKKQFKIIKDRQENYLSAIY